MKVYIVKVEYGDCSFIENVYGDHESAMRRIQRLVATGANKEAVGYRVVEKAVHGKAFIKRIREVDFLRYIPKGRAHLSDYRKG
jgi:hypothetical protein